MTNLTHFSRRSVLTMLAAAGLTAPGSALTSPASGTGPVLRSLLDAQRNSAAHLGRAWLVMMPAEADTAILLRHLEASVSTLAASARRGDLAAVESALSDRISADFAAGQSAELDGWVMSHTEARLCALHALAVDPQGVLS
jgi:hypothetical protein